MISTEFQGPVYAVYHTGDEKYPRLAYSHPRNRDIDWTTLAEYGRTGDSQTAPDFDIFVKHNSRVDTVWFSGATGCIVSSALRSVLEPLVGETTGFLPVKVNGAPYWIIRPQRVSGPLDREKSDLYLSPIDGSIRLVNKPVWRSDQIADPSLFILTDYPMTMWTTPKVVRAYEESGCTGMAFGSMGEVE